MWAQQSRFEDDFASFARVARDAGYTGIEVSHSTDLPGIEALLGDGVVPVRSLHAPAPRMNGRRGLTNSALNLAAKAEEERCEAVEHTLRTIDVAGRAGARTVIVHLGSIVGRTLFPQETTLRRLFEQGRIDSPEAEIARSDAHRMRAALAPDYLDAAARSLAELADAAAASGVVLGLENRLHFHEIPSAAETAVLLAAYPLELVGYWHDTGHAEVQGRLGLIDPRAALESLADRLVGAHLHDVRGILDHRAPGNGDIDWNYIAAALPPDTVRTLEIDQREPEPLLSEALEFLRERGVLGTDGNETPMDADERG